MRRNMSLQYELRLGRHFEIDGFTLHQASRLAQKPARDLKLIQPVGGGGCSGGVKERMMADKDRHRHRFIPLLVFLIIFPGVARIEQYPDLSEPLICKR